MLVVTPYATTEEKQARFNTACDIAAEYGVPFIDYNLRYEEIDMDFATDMADDGHLNAEGAAKFTRVFGAYLRDEYPLADWRSEDASSMHDPEQESAIRATWDADAAYLYRRLEKGE